MSRVKSPPLPKSAESINSAWIAHARPFDFSHGDMAYDDSVRRFSQGTPNIPSLYSVLPGLKIIEEVSVARIAVESRRRTQRIVDAAQEKGWRLHSPLGAEMRGGTVMIEVDHDRGSAAARPADSSMSAPT